MPADGRVIEARDFFVNQALLTGEPYPVEKHAGDMVGPATGMNAASNAPVHGDVGHQRNGFDAGVPHRARSTSLGEISDSLVVKPPATAFESGIRNFGVLILRLAILMVLFVLLVNALFHRPWLRVIPVRRGARSGAHPRAAAHGGLGHARPRARCAWPRSA